MTSLATSLIAIRDQYNLKTLPTIQGFNESRCLVTLDHVQAPLSVHLGVLETGIILINPSVVVIAEYVLEKINTAINIGYHDAARSIEFSKNSAGLYLLAINSMERPACYTFSDLESLDHYLTTWG